MNETRAPAHRPRGRTCEPRERMSRTSLQLLTHGGQEAWPLGQRTRTLRPADPAAQPLDNAARTADLSA